MSLMSNILTFPAQPVRQPLRRPAALVRAAIAGQARWRRERDRIFDWVETHCWSDSLQAFVMYPGSDKLDAQGTIGGTDIRIGHGAVTLASIIGGLVGHVRMVGRRSARGAPRPRPGPFPARG